MGSHCGDPSKFDPVRKDEFHTVLRTATSTWVHRQTWSSLLLLCVIMHPHMPKCAATGPAPHRSARLRPSSWKRRPARSEDGGGLSLRPRSKPASRAETRGRGRAAAAEKDFARPGRLPGTRSPPPPELPGPRRARAGEGGGGARGVTKPSERPGPLRGGARETRCGPPSGEGGASTASAPSRPLPRGAPAAPCRGRSVPAARAAKRPGRAAPEGRRGARRRRAYKREGAGGGRKWAVQLPLALLFGLWTS